MRAPLAAARGRMKTLGVLPNLSTVRAPSRGRKCIPMMPTTAGPHVVRLGLPLTLWTSDSDFAHDLNSLCTKITNDPCCFSEIQWPWQRAGDVIAAK